MRDAVLAAAVFVLVWQAVVTLGDLPPFILPPPLAVAETLWSSRELIAEHALVTMTEVLAGLALGTLLGAWTAISLVMSRAARAVVLPFLVFSQAIPVFALAPILVLWLGYGIGSKIAMAVLIIYFPVASAFYDGLRRTEAGLIDLASVMGAHPWRTLWHIRIPAALPALGSGLRLGAVYAPIGAVIGEWVGASNGLGYLMLLANGRAKIDLMFAALFVLAGCTVLLYALIGMVARRLERYAADIAE
ncbi:MAG: ABC transporter permease [Pseudomonadota bacterium]